MNFHVPECVANPGRLVCLHCKGFRTTGICSHVIAVNHFLRLHNAKAAVAAYGKGKPKNKGGYHKGVRRALEVEDDMSTDHGNNCVPGVEW